MRIMGGILSLGLVAMLAVGCSDSAPTSNPTVNPIVNSGTGDPEPTEQGGVEIYRAVMNGAQEVPMVETSARGSTSFHLSEDGSSIIYAITVNDISDVTMAHIHAGAPGEIGAPVVDLFIGMKPGRYDGLLVQGKITAAELKGSLAGRSIADLHALLRSGGAYVNVHTTQHPNGEIRGQVTTSPADDQGPA
jgi:hypothetical protein